MMKKMVISEIREFCRTNFRSQAIVCIFRRT